MSGHSFGGMTAIEVALKTNDVKCVISLDPYFLHRQKEIDITSKIGLL